MAQTLVEHKLGRIFSVDLGFGGRYNSEYGLLVTMGASQYNGKPDSAWETSDFIGVSHVETNTFHSFVNDFIVSSTTCAHVTINPVVCHF